MPLGWTLSTASIEDLRSQLAIPLTKSRLEDLLKLLQ